MTAHPANQPEAQARVLNACARHRLCIAVNLCLLLPSASSRAATPSGISSLEPEAFRLAASRIEPAMVTIETVGGAMPPEAHGGGASFRIADGPTTGLVYTADGLIITSSFNFVRDPSVITVTLADGRRFVADLLARDEIRKLAMLRIEATGLPEPQWCSRGGLRVGQWALALGRAFGGQHAALSVGMITAVGRFDGLATQTDAKLSPVNYGGPLIDLDGRVVGVCVPIGPNLSEMAGARMYDSGVGFAIGGERIAAVADRLARGESIVPGKFGARIQPATPDGVLILAVAEQSPANQTGMSAGDRIVEIDGHRVADVADLKRVMVTRAAGEKVTITLMRGQERMTLRVDLWPMADITGFPKPDSDPPPASQPTTTPASQPATQPAA